MKIVELNIERELNFRIEGECLKGRVFVGNIEFQEEKKRWACEWDLSYLHHEVSKIYGKDPLDALLNTLDFLATFIRGSERDGYGIWWKEEGDHGGVGFPMTQEEFWKRKR
jgi:hypothetical protein